MKDYVTHVAHKDFEQAMRNKFGDRYAEYRTKWTLAGMGKLLPEFPLHLDIETIDACNLRCKMCGATYTGRSYDTMTDSVFRAIIDEGAENGLYAVGFGYCSESLMDKTLVDKIHYARDKGIMDLRLTTNGLLLNDAKMTGYTSNVKDLLESGLTFLSVSIDAATPETYKLIRHHDLAWLEETVDILMARRKGDLPIIRVSFCCMPVNVHEADAFVEKWINRVDYIDIQRYTDVEVFLAIHNGKTVKSKPAEGFFCYQPWQRLSIAANTKIAPCCTFLGREIEPLGTAGKDSIQSAWQSPRMNHIREMLAKRAFSGVCQACAGSWRTLWEEKEVVRCGTA